MGVWDDCVRLSNDTANALNQLEICGYVGRVNSDEPAMAWLFFVARELPDTDQIFPRGKWATIQHIEGQLIKMAQLRAEQVTKEMNNDGGMVS